jgi:hypothetical protein
MKKRIRQDAARARFILKDKSERETLIYLTIRIDKKRIKWSTGEKVNPKNWSTQTRRAIVRARNLEAQTLNERLDNYAKEAVALHTDWLLSTPAGLATYNPDKYKLELEYRLGMKERPESKTEKLDTSDFVRFAESVRDHRKDSTGIVRGTWKVLNNHTNLLREFADLRHGGIVAFTEVDELFLDGFKKFLFRTKGHNRRTVHKVMVTLRSIASRAADRNLMTYGKRFRGWAKQEFRKLPQPALTRPELDKVIALDLTETPRLERVRDLFLIGVATAQRWSDYSLLTPKNFYSLPGGRYRYFIASQQKTSKKAGGPVMSWIIPTLEKYGYIGNSDFNPPKISSVKFNLYLKEVAKLAFPDAMLTLYNDREQVDHEGTEVEKWTKISSHAARRTAVGLLRSMKAPDDQIQKMTGHKTLSELDGYDVRDAETLALELGRDLDTAWQKSLLRAV